jgi:putative holliday junction resolvase
MKYLGIDYGHKRIGIAFADGSVVVPLTTIEVVSDNFDEVIQKIISTATLYGCDGIVVGVPIPLAGGENEQLRITRLFVEKLKNQSPYDVYEVNEVMSSQLSDRFINEGSEKGRDELSAMNILNLYIEKNN